MAINNSINAPKTLIQMKYTSTTTYSAEGSLIPTDDTIPQINEGSLLLSVSITPKINTSILELEALVPVKGKIPGTNFGCALFKTGTNDALGSMLWCWQFGAEVGGAGLMPITHRMVSGSTTAATFQLRIDGRGSGQYLYVNGDNTARKYGGVQRAIFIVKEYYS